MIISITKVETAFLHKKVRIDSDAQSKNEAIWRSLNQQLTGLVE